MITESPSNREVYLTEVSRQLRKAGFTVGSMQDGLLPVSMEEHQVCQINSKGTVFFQPESIGQELEPARKRASDIVWETAEYIRLLEQVPPLKAEGLSSPYKVLAEFNGVVLAGELTGYGAQFATWQWVQGRTGLWQGHYHSSYENAKRDFTTRSGLLLESALFTPEQMAEIYLCIDLELDGSTIIRDEREKVLRGILGQLERLLPDVAERAEQSFLKDPDMENVPKPPQFPEM